MGSTFFPLQANACTLGDGVSVGQCISSLVEFSDGVLEVDIFVGGVGREVSFFFCSLG